jgi:hypothetical protein
VVVCPVGSLTYKGEKTTFCAEGMPGPVFQSLYDGLTKIQTGQATDPHGWVVPVDKMQDVVSAAQEP